MFRERSEMLHTNYKLLVTSGKRTVAIIGDNDIIFLTELQISTVKEEIRHYRSQHSAGPTAHPNKSRKQVIAKTPAK
jgi:hypothetical protein